MTANCGIHFAGTTALRVYSATPLGLFEGVYMYKKTFKITERARKCECGKKYEKL